LEEVRTHKLSVRRGAELLQMPYRAFLDLMAAHRVPVIDPDASWLDHEQQQGKADLRRYDVGPA
jgi:predicted HTH domain antitoxin